MLRILTGTCRAPHRRSPRTILVVEDEASIAEAVATRLRSEGFAVSIAADGPSGRRALRTALDPDLVVLDLMLPGLDGLEVCRAIQRDRPVPVLMLTARDSETDLVVGLAVGADDYLTKPFSSRELVARVHALLRRVDRTSPTRQRRRAARSATVTIDLAGAGASATTATSCTSPRPSSTCSCTSPSDPGACSPASSCSSTVWGYPDGSGRAHRRLARARAAPQARQRHRAHRARRRVRARASSSTPKRRAR